MTSQQFFQQKKFQESKELSEALGRVTIEETTVSDSGRIMESVMGRALATPDELMRLERHCIAFTNDTPALKIPVVAPDAHSLALAYPPPEAAEHEISDFIRNRGKSPGEALSQDEGSDNGKNRKRDRGSDRPSTKEPKRKKQTERTREPEQGKPDMGNVWE